MLASRAFSLLGKQSISTSICVRAHRHGIVKTEDFSLPSCVDLRTLPLPEVTYTKVLSSEQRARKEKEKASWSALSGDEKVELYHIQFKATCAEMNKGSAEWKTITGGGCVFLGLTGFLYIWQNKYVCGPLPHTMSDEWKAMQTKRMLALRANPIEGISSKWDYEKNEWKK